MVDGIVMSIPQHYAADDFCHRDVHWYQDIRTSVSPPFLAGYDEPEKPSVPQATKSVSSALTPDTAALISGTSIDKPTTRFVKTEAKWLKLRDVKLGVVSPSGFEPETP
jgi:hypothetical protein